MIETFLRQKRNEEVKIFTSLYRLGSLYNKVEIYKVSTNKGKKNKKDKK